MPEAAATRYFVSQTIGDDGANGKLPEKGDGGGPWKTLARASQQDFVNGDELLLHCGETYEGRLELRVGRGDGQLRVAGFGDCAAADTLPRLDATKPIELTPGGGRRRARLSFEPGRVLVDGKLVPRAFTQFRVVADPGTSALPRLQPPLPAGAGLAHAQAFVRTRDWLVEPIRLEGVGGPVGLGSTKTRYPIAAGVALAITGKEWVLRDGSWVFDAASKELVVAGIRGAVHVAEPLPLLRVAGAGSVLVDGLRLEFAGQDAIEISIKGAATVRGCVMVAPARRAINVQAAESFSALDNRIGGAGEDAIFIGATGRALVTRNLIQDTATFEPLQPAVGAINVVRAKTAIVRQNTLERSAYVGIRFGEGAEISSNLVVDSCVALSDCAAIYTWQKAPAADRRASRVAGNLIVGVYGSDEVKLGFWVWAVGIYLDDFSSAVRVEDNAVFGARQGIYLHNAFQNKLVRNVSVGDLEASMSVQLDVNDAYLVSRGNLGNDVSGSVMLPAEKSVAVSVVRRIRLEPFAEFSARQLGGAAGSGAISWFENVAGFDNPTFKREVAPSPSWSVISKGLSYQTAASIAVSKSWRVLFNRTGFDISAAARHFRLIAASGDAVPVGCKEVSTLQSGPLTLSSERTAVLDCGQ